MNICFLANKHLTRAYLALSEKISKDGHTIFWISPSRRWANWLIEQGVRPDRCLILPEFQSRWQSMPADQVCSILTALEQPDLPTIANILQMDRVLRQKSTGLALAYLATIAEAIGQFIQTNDIRCCFGESTWAWELVAWLACRRLGRKCLNFTMVRIPADRWGFFEPINHSILAWRPPQTADIEWATGFLAEWRNRPSRPSWFGSGPSALRFRRYWWEELRRRLRFPDENDGDMTLWPMKERVAFRSRLALNALGLRLSPPFEPVPTDPNRKFALFCLHHQPEASIDVVGCYHSDQAHLITRLSRLLPASHELWVKEHPDALGDRSPAWLRQIAALPGVRLIDPRASTHELIRRADLVITVSGTVGYEAALMGARSLALADIFFDPVMAISAKLARDPLNWPLAKLLAAPLNPQLQERRCIDFLAFLHAQSFPGFPDRLAGQSIEGRFDDALVTQVRDGFREILAWLETNAHPVIETPDFL